jgi:hypothetical protein
MCSQFQPWLPIHIHYVFRNLPLTSFNQLAVEDFHSEIRKHSHGEGSGNHNYRLLMGS